MRCTSIFYTLLVTAVVSLVEAIDARSCDATNSDTDSCAPSNCPQNPHYSVSWRSEKSESSQWNDLCVHQYYMTKTEYFVSPNIQFTETKDLCNRGSAAEQHNNFVSISPGTILSGGTMDYPIRMKVTRKGHSTDKGFIRPRHLAEDGEKKEVGEGAGNNGRKPTDIWIRKPTYIWIENDSGTMEFIINRPCQLSVEVGEENDWFPTTGQNANRDHVQKLESLLVFANPPLQEPSGYTAVKIDPENVDTERLKTDPVNINENEILRVETQEQANVLSCTALPSSGCKDHGSNATRTIKLAQNSGLFIAENVVLRAMVSSKESKAFVYGYGALATTTRYSTEHTSTEHTTHDGYGIIRLEGEDSWINGPILLNSGYRNMEISQNAKISWTKSMTGCGETDGVGVAFKPNHNKVTDTNITVMNSFFRVHDDVLKMYYDDSLYKDITIWHTSQGRALMYSWGNGGETQTIKSIRAENIYVIHDEQYYEAPDPKVDTAEKTGNTLDDVAIYSSNMAYYSPIIGLLKQNSNKMQGMKITGLYLESVVGQVLNVFNGFYRPTCLRDDVTWFEKDVCAGNVAFEVSDISTKYLTGVARKSSITGCEKNFNKLYDDCPMTCGCNPDFIKCEKDACSAKVILRYKEKPPCDHRCIDVALGPKGDREIEKGCEC